MLKYIFQRLLFTIVVIFGVSILVFLITHVIGSPVDVMLPLQATAEERAALTHAMGLDKPLLTQLAVFLGQIVRLDFGVSWWQSVPCLQIIAERMPKSVLLIACSYSLAVLIALPLGIIAAYKPNSVLDRVLTSASLIGVCLPEFWTALMLMLFFALKLGWFYTSGYGTIRHLVLPAMTLAILPAGHLAQIVRFSMQEQLGAPYTITARAKGVGEWNVLMKHNLKNVMTSALTIFGADLGAALAGHTASVEVVFGWPGFGQLIVETINQQDFPLLQTEVFIVSIIICFINLAIDILYAYFDPRIRY